MNKPPAEAIHAPRALEKAMIVFMWSLQGKPVKPRDRPTAKLSMEDPIANISACNSILMISVLCGVAVLFVELVGLCCVCHYTMSRT
mmetsp:Transcript_15692/g.21516  ORF Transcript_15692/g.21516 Transcript_15692/m.21516 type:complete len:87 (-) Transcript_15692:36-296(-)